MINPLAESAAAASVGFLPANISRPRDTAAYLAWVRSQIPELYQQTKDYVVRFWSLVEEQNDLQRRLQSDPDFQTYLETKRKLIHIRIDSPASVLRPEFDVSRFLAAASEVISNEACKLASGDGDSGMIGALSLEIKRQIQLSGNGSSTRLLNDLVSLIDPQKRGVLKQNLTIQSVLELIQSQCMDLDGLDARAFGMEGPLNGRQVEERYWFLKEREASLSTLRQALIYLENETLFLEQDQAKILQFLEALPKGDMKSCLAKFRLVSPSGESVSPEIHLELREQPIATALWKNIVGVDCTPSRFAFAPSERTFFIYDRDKPAEPKGYLSTAIVLGEKMEKLLLIKGAQGPQIHPEELDAILSESQAIAQTLGAERAVVLRVPITNYRPLGWVYMRYADIERPVRITFSDSQIRLLFDAEPGDPEGLHHSESMRRLSETVEMFCDGEGEEKKAPLQVTMLEIPVTQLPLPEPSRMDCFEAGLAYAKYMSAHPSVENERLLRELGLNLKPISELVELLDHPTRYTTLAYGQELESRLRASDESIQLSALTDRLSYLTEANSMRFQDAFDPENEMKSLAALLRKLRKIRNRSTEEFRDFISIEKKAAPGLKAKILSLIETAENWEDLKIVSILISFLGPEHLDDEYSALLSDLISRTSLFLGNSIRRVQADIPRNLRAGGFFEIVNHLFSYQHRKTMELARLWEQPSLYYFLDLRPEIRAEFPEFRTQVLDHLRKKNPSEFWLKKDEYPVTLAEIDRLILRDGPSVLESFSEMGRQMLAGTGNPQEREKCPLPGSAGDGIWRPAG